MPGPAAVGACSSSFRRVPAPSTGSKGRRVRAGQGTYRGSRRCAQHGRSHSGGKRRTWTFPSRGFYSGRYSPMSRRAKALGHGLVRITPPAALVAHPPSQPANHANTDAGNRFERHGNRAGVAARGRNPPVWCERMNGVLLTALSGSQPLWIRGGGGFGAAIR